MARMPKLDTPIMSLKNCQLLFCGLLLLWSATGTAQSPIPPGAYAPVGKFLADTMKIGQDVQYSLVLRHPAWLEVRFPDSISSYAPFELKSKKYFPTVTGLDGNSIDSAVYTLTTFDSDSIQRLALPVMVLAGTDTSLVAGTVDSIRLALTVLNSPGPDQLIAHANYMEVPKGINYPLIGLGLLGVVVVALGIYLVFGERIRRSFRLQRMKRRYERFLAEFDRQNNTRNSTMMEHAVAVWKAYLQGLHGKPYTSFTSKEMAEAIADEQMIHSLKTIDRVIYGHLDSEAPQQALLILRKFAENAYQQQIGEVRNA